MVDDNQRMRGVAPRMLQMRKGPPTPTTHAHTHTPVHCSLPGKHTPRHNRRWCGGAVFRNIKPHRHVHTHTVPNTTCLPAREALPEALAPFSQCGGRAVAPSVNLGAHPPGLPPLELCSSYCWGSHARAHSLNPGGREALPRNCHPSELHQSRDDGTKQRCTPSSLGDLSRAPPPPTTALTVPGHMSIPPHQHREPFPGALPLQSLLKPVWGMGGGSGRLV